MDRDQLIEEVGLLCVDEMKLDAGGGDLETPRGPTRLLVQYRPIPICEAPAETIRVSGYYVREVISTLNGPKREWFECQADGAPSPSQGPQQLFHHKKPCGGSAREACQDVTCRGLHRTNKLNHNVQVAVCPSHTGKHEL